MKKNQLNIMIDIFRKEREWTLEELGARMGKSKSAISRWIKGDRSPMVEDVEKLADLFDTDVMTLLYGQKKQITVSKTLSELIKHIRQLSEQDQQTTLVYVKQLKNQSTHRTLFPVKVIEALAAGVGYHYGNNEESTVYTDRSNLKPYDIASAISGNSMEPLIHDGDIALIAKNRQLKNGSIYAIDYDGKSYIKKVYLEKNMLRLVSFNQNYDDILISIQSDNYLNIVGEVVDWFTPVHPFND